MSALTTDEEDLGQIEELRRKLQDLEAKVALRAKTNTLHSVAADCQDSQLGPSVFAEVQVNGVSTKALIDTGSPATIISLDFVLDIFAEQRDRRESPEQWRQNTMRKFSPLTISLKNYGGHSLSIISQTPLKLTATPLAEGPPEETVHCGGSTDEPSTPFCEYPEMDVLSGGEGESPVLKTGVVRLRRSRSHRATRRW